MNSDEWFAKQNTVLFGVSRDGRCDHYTHVYFESTSMKNFKVLVRCDDYKGHFGTHHNTARNIWTSSESVNEKGKKAKQ